MDAIKLQEIMLKEDMMSYSLAKLAKQKGYDAWCFEYRYHKDTKELGAWAYADSYPCTSLSLLQKWLREKYDLHIDIIGYHDYNTGERLYCMNIADKEDMECSIEFVAYEVALAFGLQETLKLLRDVG